MKRPCLPLPAVQAITLTFFFLYETPCRVLHCCGWRGSEGSLKLIVSDPPGPPALHPIRQDVVNSDEHLLIF